MGADDLLDALEPGLILSGRPKAQHPGTRFKLEGPGWKAHEGRVTLSLDHDLVPEMLGHPKAEGFRLARSDDRL